MLSRSGLLRFTLQSALKSLIEGGLDLLVFRLRDLVLPPLHFELEEFFLDAFHQHGSRTSRTCGNNFRSFVVVFFLHGGWPGSFFARERTSRRLLPGRHVNAADDQDRSQAS